MVRMKKIVFGRIGRNVLIMLNVMKVIFNNLNVVWCKFVFNFCIFGS